MRRPLVKICGITRSVDALIAVEAGASAVGFVLIKSSPRYIDPERARAIAASLPSGVARVGVVAGLAVPEVRSLVRAIGLTTIQAHGEETPEACRAFGVPVVKAIPAGEDFDLRSLESYREFPLLLDGVSPDARGGTGNPANWGGARAARDAGYRILLAGGLDPDNVLSAVREVGPVALDLNSGVENAPGEKNADRVRLAMKRLETLDPPEEISWPW